MLILDEEDVASVVDVPAAVSQMEKAFRELGRQRVLTPNRFTMSIPGSFGTLRLMPSALLDSKVSGFKVLAGTAGHREVGRNYFLVLLLDQEDGSVRCIMSASRLTQLRTGAISALATRYLARKGSTSLGLVGAGVQGHGQVEAICSTLKLAEVRVYDHDPEKASRTAGYASDAFGVEAKAVGRVEDALGSDIVATATTSSSPFMDRSNIAPGTHINAIGSNVPSRKEIHSDLLKASKVVVDLRDQAVQESGDLEPVRKGELGPGAIYAELAELVEGTKRGRTDESEITIFKSVGIAVQDIAIAQLLYERAAAKGIGRQVEL